MPKAFTSVSVVAVDALHRYVPLLTLLVKPEMTKVVPENAFDAPPVMMPVYTVCPPLLFATDVSCNATLGVYAVCGVQTIEAAV